MPPNRYDACFNGGSVRGGALVGALAAIEEVGFLPSHFIGASAGAIVAALRIGGYTPPEIKQIMDDLDYNVFLDCPGWVPKTFAAIHYHGIHPGDTIRTWIRELLGKKGVKEFGDLKFANPSEDRYKYQLTVVAADITNRQLIRFPWDAKQYGIEPDRLPVDLAVRCSMSIPYFFRPVILNGCYIVDGGLISNFPIWEFDSEGTPAHPTFGLLLETGGKTEKSIITSNVTFISAMINTMLDADDKMYIRPEDLKIRTISLPTGTVGMLDFSLTKEEKQALYDSGYAAAKRFLATWSWEKYVEWAKRVRGVEDD